MAYHGKSLLYRSAALDGTSDSKPKLQGRDQLRRLKTIKEYDPAEMSMDLGRPKLVRQGSNELAGNSPYATTAKYPLLRSKSVTKFKSRAGKQASPGKERGPKAGPFHIRTASLSLAKKQQPATMKFSHSLKKASFFSQSFSFKDGLKPDDNMSQSFMTNHTDSPHASKESPLLRDLQVISERLERGLRAIEEQGESDWRAEMQVYSKAFEEVIGLGVALGGVLDRIKGKYELWIEHLTERQEREIGKWKEEAEQLRQTLLKETEEKKAIKRKFEKISRESVELSRSCDSYQNKCFEFQEKLYEIANVSLDDFPPSETAWRLLISELETYKTWKESAEKELKTAQQKEQKLLQLLHAIKKHGFPVEEVYNTEVKKAAKAESSSRRESGESSDAEPIATGPPLRRKRPDQVPVLKIEAIDVEESSASESFSLSSTLNEWKNASGKPDQSSKSSSTHKSLNISSSQQTKAVQASGSSVSHSSSEQCS